VVSVEQWVAEANIVKVTKGEKSAKRAETGVNGKLIPGRLSRRMEMVSSAKMKALKSARHWFKNLAD
jgi:hypothetical protein